MRSAALLQQCLVHFVLPFRFGVCDNALPAAAFEAWLVRPSRRGFDAAEAAFLPVCLAGALRCDIALPAADFEPLPVDLLMSVFDALLAAGLLVTFQFLAMGVSSYCYEMTEMVSWGVGVGSCIAGSSS